MRRALALSCALLLSSCGEELTTDSGRVHVAFADLYVDPLTSMDSTHPVLLGTCLCPTLSTDGVDVTGSYSLPEDGCFVAGAVGPLTLSFGTTETLTLEVVDDVSAEVYAWPEV